MKNKQKLKELFKESLSISEEKVNDKLKYNEIEEWDSIGHMTLMSAIEEEFKITLETDDIIDFSSFQKGMNPYIGLEEYISWDRCGIQRGGWLTATQYEKLSEGDKEKCRRHDYTDDKGKEKFCYFQPKDTARKLCVEHLNDSVELNRLYTPEVLTDEVLQKLEPFVNEKFSYGNDELDVNALNDIINTEEHVKENA